ncbi:MAG: phosphoribosylanthranilate isomerase [Nitrososphaerales archaeon]|nr:phosphoribosylanthranilate isomerase [Nitrososphaerales archaeon]
MRVKICGITRTEDLDAAVEAGADAVGFIVGFPGSKRNLSLEVAGEMIRRVPPFVDSVLVTTSDIVEDRTDKIVSIGPNAIQLHGQGDPRVLRRALGLRLIRAYLVSDGGEDAREAARGFDALLTDTYVKGQSGGTGKTSDWAVCRAVREGIAPVPLILSGGLRPENVLDAIEVVRPYAVDVSSGVESTPGVKDRAKVFEFVRRAKERTKE